jgi:hypothetical protein
LFLVAEEVGIERDAPRAAASPPKRRGA